MPIAERSICGKTAVIGVGETEYYKHGKADRSEFRLALDAIMAACDDAGISPRDIDGFASYGDDRNDPARLANALGLKRLRLSNMQWGGGGGGVAAAVANASAAVAAGYADCVVVFRALAQGQFGRYGAGSAGQAAFGDNALNVGYGMISPAQRMATRVRRFMHDYGVSHEAFRAIALASYHHAQTNPRATMFGRPLTVDNYESSKWIVEPFRLYDCCQENDGAAAVIVVAAERARDSRTKPAYVLGAAQGSSYRFSARGHNDADYSTANFRSVADDLYRSAGVGPSDVDVVQAYENFTGAVLLALVEHGFFAAEEANEFMQLENLIAPSGRLPLNTSGGHLAEAYMHGLNLVIEAVRQIRGTSTAQVHDAAISMVISGPMVTPTSSLIFSSEEAIH